MSVLPHLVIYTVDTPSSIKEQLNSPPLPSKFLPPIIPARTFAIHLLTSFRDVTSLLFSTLPSIVLLEHEGDEETSRKAVKDVIKRIRFGNGGASITGSGDGGGSTGKRVLIILWSHRASLDPRERTYWTSKGVNMVTSDMPALRQVLQCVNYLHSPIPSNTGSSLAINGSMPNFASRSSSASSSSIISQTSTCQQSVISKGSSVASTSHIVAPCPYCAIPFTFAKLHIHIPLYHSQESDGTVCTLCEECVVNLSAHVRDIHPINASTLSEVPVNFFYVGEDKTLTSVRMEQMMNKYLKKKPGRIPIFALVVVRNPTDGKYLLTDEIGSQVKKLYLVILNFIIFPGLVFTWRWSRSRRRIHPSCRKGNIKRNWRRGGC